MANKTVVRITRNFERNLDDIEKFLAEAGAPQAYDELLDELLDTVIPNLERFPDMGRPFLIRQPHSVESTNALERLRGQFSTLLADSMALREYILAGYLLLYARTDGILYLLAIKHHRQLSFDFECHWGSTPALPD